MKKNVLIKALSLATLAIFSLNSIAFAQDANLNKLVEQMQTQMSQMQQTINAQNAKIATIEGHTGGVNIGKPVDPQVEEQKIKTIFEKQLGKDYATFKDLKFTGDLRLRYEAFHNTNASTTAVNLTDRNRFRYRLRTGLEKKFSDEIMAGFSLSSAGTADPTSGNETFDNNFVYKTIAIDRAYATYTPNWGVAGPVSKTEITAGKFKNPFELGSSDMIWDRDVRPEGVYEKVDFRLWDEDNLKVLGYATAGQFVLNETGPAISAGTSAASTDANLFAYQIGLNPKFKVPGMEKPVNFLSAVSVYDYQRYASDGNFAAGGAFGRGNINIAGATTQLDAGDFMVYEWYNEFKFTPIDSLPVWRASFDWARNAASKAPDASYGKANDAWGLGLKIGEAKTKGQWEAGYEYKYISPNSVVGAFNDSDFGDGHADKQGSVLKAKYMLTDYLEVGAAGFFVSNVSNIAGAGTSPEYQTKRFQLDLLWKW